MSLRRPRLRRPRADDEREGWELSLADMMTLLSASSCHRLGSAVDLARYREVARSLGSALGVRPSTVGAPPTLAEMKAQLMPLITPHAPAVELEERPSAVALNLRDAVFFELGKAELTPQAIPLLERLAPALKALPYPLVVEGHTDDLPIQSLQFPSNWELSAARAAAVARFLIGRGVAPGRVRVSGLADTRPLVPNHGPGGEPLPENQAKNRRVVILVAPDALF